MAFIGVPGPAELLILTVFGLGLIGGIVILIMLLANPKTRVAGIVLLLIGMLGIGAIVVVGGIGAALLWNSDLQRDEVMRPMPVEVESFEDMAPMPDIEVVEHEGPVVTSGDVDELTDVVEGVEPAPEPGIVPNPTVPDTANEPQ